MSDPRLSVVIPVLDNASGLRRTLAALIPQCADDVEIVVVDDGSTDDTSAVAAAALATAPVGRLVAVTNGGPSAARNRGAAAARGRLLAFLDANDEPLAGWVDAFARTVRPDAPAVIHCRPILDDAGLDTTYAHLLPGCFAIERALFDQIDGYDEALRFAENTDLVERAHARARETGRAVVVLDDVLLAVHDITDPRRYDGRRTDAMLHLLQRDRGRLDAETAERYARVGAVAAVRSRRHGDAVRLATAAVRARPANPRNWTRLVATLVPPVARRRWGSS